MDEALSLVSHHVPFSQVKLPAVRDRPRSSADSTPSMSARGQT